MDEGVGGKGRDVLLLVLATMFWGLAFPLTRFVVGQVPPVLAAFLRYGAAGLIFAAVLAVRGPRPGTLRPGRILLWLALGATGIFGYNWLFFVGLTMASASEASVIIPLLNPLVVAAMAALVLREKLGKNLLQGGGVALLGTLVIVAGGMGGLSLNAAGDLLFLGSTVCWGAYSVLSRVDMRESSPLLSTGAGVILGSLMLFPQGWGQRGSAGPGLASPWVWGAILFMAVFSTFLAFTWWNMGMKRLGAARAAVFIYLVPLTGLLSSQLFLGERMAPVQWAGAGIVLGGVLMANKKTPP